jgi:hypothetical protein
LYNSETGNEKFFADFRRNLQKDAKKACGILVGAAIAAPSFPLALVPLFC